MPQPPNLLLITTDQQRWDSLSLYGRGGYRTPVLDRLGAEGRVFDRAYCSSPLCTPTRVSLLTGMYPSRHGAFTIGTPHVPALEGPTLPRLLKHAGYHSAIIGKTHFVARALEQNHVAGRFDAACDDPDPDPSFWRDFDGPYVGFDFVRHCAVHTNDRLPEAHYRAWLDERGVNLDDRHQDRDLAERKDGVPRLGRWDVPLEYHQTEWITSETLDYLRRRQETRQPWFCWTSFQDPHPPYVCPEPYFGDADVSGMDLGGWIEGEFDDKPPFYRRLLEGEYWSDEHRMFCQPGGNVPNASLYDHVADPKTAIRAYVGMCSMIDDHVGRIVEGLDELGCRETTLRGFTSDHGDYLGRHGFGGEGLPPYDDCQRVPFVVNWPAGMADAPRGRSEAPVSVVDSPATFLEAAGLEQGVGMQGVSQLPVLTGERERARDWVLVEFEPTHEVAQRSFVCGDYKLVIYRDAEYGELYNLREDPDQLTNLWDHESVAPLRARLMHRLARADVQREGRLPPRVSHA